MAMGECVEGVEGPNAPAQGQAPAQTEVASPVEAQGMGEQVLGHTVCGADTGGQVAPVQCRFKRDETLVLLDWDDTILPSSWVALNGLKLDEQPAPPCAAALEKLSAKVCTFLEACKAMGRLVIVTNAETGWVERSCATFLPSVYPILEDVRVCSARSTFELAGAFSPLLWKRKAFAAELEVHALGVRNILSLGDSAHERDALFSARNELPAQVQAEVRTKSVKLMEKPDPDQLHREHCLLVDYFEQVVQHDGDLDLCVKCC